MRQPPAAEFTALYRANYGRVLRFVARRSPEAGDAEDITADVFRIAWDRARATLADLDERHRSVLVLRYWDGLNAAEIAEHLDLSVSAVWVRLHRARRAFQKGAAHAHG
jgi:DNA-directed RNA polymerase specialized sigma24 family protein